MYLTLGVNGGTRKSKSMETKAVKSCLLTFSKSTWITLYNFVCVGANLFQFSFRYDVFGSGKCRMRCPESNVRIGKQICVSALALLLYEIPYEYLHQNFDRKQSLFSTFGHFLCLFRRFTATFWKNIFSTTSSNVDWKFLFLFSLFTAVENLKSQTSNRHRFPCGGCLNNYLTVRPDLSRSFSAAISAFFRLIISASFSSHSSLVSA